VEWRIGKYCGTILMDSIEHRVVVAAVVSTFHAAMEPTTKKITVEGVGGVIGGVKLSTDAELVRWLSKMGVDCLRDRDGDEVVGFASLVNGGVYTLGPPKQQQQPYGKLRCCCLFSCSLCWSNIDSSLIRILVF
jgi:hypothetical protein